MELAQKLYYSITIGCLIFFCTGMLLAPAIHSVLYKNRWTVNEFDDWSSFDE